MRLENWRLNLETLSAGLVANVEPDHLVGAVPATFLHP